MARMRTKGMLPISKIRQSRRVMARDSSAVRTVRHFSGGSGGMRIITVTAGHPSPTVLSAAVVTFIVLGTFFLGWRGVPD